MNKPFELPTRDHVGQELSEISQAYLDKRITAKECVQAWILALERSTLLGSTVIPEDQVADLALFFSEWQDYVNLTEELNSIKDRREV